MWKIKLLNMITPEQVYRFEIMIEGHRSRFDMKIREVMALLEKYDLDKTKYKINIVIDRR